MGLDDLPDLGTYDVFEIKSKSGSTHIWELNDNSYIEIAEIEQTSGKKELFYVYGKLDWYDKSGERILVRPNIDPPGRIKKRCWSSFKENEGGTEDWKFLNLTDIVNYRTLK